MTPHSDIPPHESPYPGVEHRVSALEGWRGSMDEWRRGMESWRATIEREGLVTAVAVIGTKLEQVSREVGYARREIRDVKADVGDLVGEKNERKGFALTWKSILGILGGGASFLTIIGLLVALLAK